MAEPNVNWKDIGNKLQNYINAEKKGLEENKGKVPYKNDTSVWINKETFLKKISQDEGLFNALDRNRDGLISESECEVLMMSDNNEDGKITEEEQQAMQQAEYFAKRTIDKWFTLDIDRDGHWSNVEDKLGDCRMYGELPDYYLGLDAAMTNEELAQKYNMKEVVEENGTTLDWWMDNWLNGDINDSYKSINGTDLSDKQKVFLKQEMIKQLNTWLFKTGDNATKDAPLYNSLNLTAYTRLITREQTVSCCGGDIAKPPMASQDGCSMIFSSIDKKNDTNSAEEVKNRLAWAFFKCKSKEETDKMTPAEYQKYQAEWNKARKMTSVDFRNLLKPENKAQKDEFEKNSGMTVEQIVQYIDIVETEIGKGNFDKEDWSINTNQFTNIVYKVNDTYKDDQLLDGKTYQDVPKNRKNLLKFLEEKGWLLPQLQNNNKDTGFSLNKYWN